ncbi:MFS transporter [Lentzea flava]|uniref:MFS transporter n=1 Tax=Lentzea flava TaxID=103732 RepID=A0ABQ2UWY1_9PSEU|nr:MFS transporter [Lentzea flava]MCP2202227.1 drug resistance transporter, EmrB/QacA subfamily [Lentzea flava]GGU58031.1 MFS transporter [Lentzea flava]
MNTSVARAVRRRGLAIALLAFAQFVVALDYNVVYVALPDIGRALGFTPQSLQWVVSAYAVGFGGFLLFGGRVADRFGARRTFVLGLVLFGFACLAGGFAGSAEALVIARGVQGFGAALLTPATLTLINTSFAEGAERNRALSVWGAAGSGGLAAGALLGGVITNALGWQWVFFLLAPIALGAAAAARPVLAPGAARTATRGGFDVAGAVLATAGSSLLVLGLVSGPEAGWASLRGGGALIIGLLLLAVFVVVEWRTGDPLVPLRLFGNRSLVIAIGVILVFQSALGGAYYLFTTYLQDVLGYNALQAGLAFVPLTLVSMAASLKLTGTLLGRWGVRATLFAGMVVNGAGMVLLAAGMAVDAPFWTVLAGLLVWGLGGGLTFPAMFVAAASGVAPEEQGVASALATTSQQIGGAIGLAVLVAVANAGLDLHSGAASAPTAVVEGLRAALVAGGIASLAGGLVAFLLKPPADNSRPDIDEGDPSVNTDQLVQKYFEAWNDFDGDQRGATIEAIFTEDADVIDPDWTAEGRDAVARAIGQSREKLGDLALGLTQVINAHNNVVLYSWHLGEQAAPVATGYGVLTLEDDRIRQACNFFG